MSILYDEGQAAIGVESRRVLDARTDKARLLALLEQTGQCDKPFWDTVVEQGWTGIGIAEDHGGLGLGLIELGLVAQACGAATAGAPFLTSGYGVASALEGGSNPDAAAQWLPKLAAGEVTGAIAFAEGSAPLPPVPATQFAAGKLSGAKNGVAGGLTADLALVWATADGAPVLVLAELSGATRTTVDSFDNSRLYADLAFANTPAVVIAQGPAAHALAMDVMARVAVVTAHEQVGGAEALMLIARDYALTRKAFGQPIGAFQMTQAKIADMKCKLDASLLLTLRAAWLKGEGQRFTTEAAVAKLTASEAAMWIAHQAVQIHGGMGYSKEMPLERYFRDAKITEIYEGTSEIQRLVIARNETGLR
jgi:acyl-CoA dehydrogenase